MSALPPRTGRRLGRIHEWRVRWFGEPDSVARQLAEIARQGSSMARLAHVCAFALIILFSAGSLVALSGDALASVVAQWDAGHVDVPAAISVAVSTLLVLCMDTGLIYAASMLRLLNSRRAERKEKRIHQIVMLTVALLEAGTYVYMSWRYEQPTTVAEWWLIVARGLAAPLLSVYLSMARPLPVTARDVLYQAELAAGQGVIRDVVEAASDIGAPLADKIALYGAAATMTPHDRTRLDEMIRAVEMRSVPAHTGLLLPAPVTPPAQWGADPEPSATTKPRGGRSIHLVEPPTKPRRRRRSAPPRGSDNWEQQARAAFASGARSKDAMVAATGMKATAAASWVRTLKAEAKARAEGAQNERAVATR